MKLSTDPLHIYSFRLKNITDVVRSVSYYLSTARVFLLMAALVNECDINLRMHKQ